MPEWIARAVGDGGELHLVVVDEVYGDHDEPFTLFVNAEHYSAGRRTLERAYYGSLEQAQADCRARFGIEPEEWRSADDLRFEHTFRFEYGVTNQGVAQPYPLGFDAAEVLFRLGKMDHPDGPSTPVLDVVGNREGLRRLAALLLLCADGDGYDDHFHIHLDRDEPVEEDERPFLTGDIDVTIRAPVYLEALRSRSFRQWSAHVDLEPKGDVPAEPATDE
jgi:hypothetical protein